MNLLAAYQLSSVWLREGLDVLGDSHASCLLDLNHTVLFGRDHLSSERNKRQKRHSEEYFYTNPGSHAGDLLDWYHGHRHQNVWRLAAGLHVRLISTPELFIEGNHRSSIVLISYLLVREGYSPLVLNADSAPIYFSLTPMIQSLDKRRPLSWFKRRRAVNEVETALRSMAELMPQSIYGISGVDS